MSGEVVEMAELSGKVRNTLETELRRTQYRAYDPDNPAANQKLVHPRDHAVLADVLKEEAVVHGIPLQQIGPAVPKRLEPLFAPGIGHGPAKQTLVEVARADVGMLARVGFREGLQPGYIQGVAVRTVLGASEEIPVRALSYLTPALHMAEAMKASGRYEGLPQVQFIIMGTAGATINGFDRGKVQDEVDQFTHVARAYVRHFHPSIEQAVVFSTDEHFFDHEEVERLVELLVADESVESHPFYPTDTAFTDRAESKRYAALHVPVHDLGISENVFRDTEGRHVMNNPKVFINVGAQSEHRFYGGRLAFRPVLDRVGIPLVPSVQVFTSHAVPPYIPLRDQDGQFADIALTDALRDPSVVPIGIDGYSGDANLLFRDLRLLRGDTDDRLHDFLASL